jgi:uncharacterized membrane protein YjgN (DUF898 family)
MATGESADGGSESYRFSFTGRGSSLFGLYLRNLAWVLLTFGIYSFWAKVRVRRFLLSQVGVAGERLAYHGLGGELLRGALKAMLVFGVPITILRLLPSLFVGDRTVAWLAWALTTLLGVVFLAVARVGARRYRLSRTSWRGIRFGFRGQAADYLRLFVTGWWLTIVTAGVYYPVYATKSDAFMTRHSYFGSARFDFDGDGKDLVLDFVYAMLLTLPTLGLAWFWYAARRREYVWSHTTLLGARFHFPVTPGELLRLKLGNLGLLVVTLGLAYPWTVVRNARFVCARLALDGPLDLASIRQAPFDATATGEGLLGLLEVDLDWV